MEQKKESDVKPLIEAFMFSGLVGPLHIFLHEMAHWVVAKLIGAKNTSIGYTHVDIGTAKSLSIQAQLPIHVAGPFSTDLLCLVGLRLAGHSNLAVKLLGWALVIPTYRNLAALVRQFTFERKELNQADRELQTDETLIAQGVGVSKLLVSIPHLMFSGWLVKTGYSRLNSSNWLIASLLGNVAGTYIYLKIIGPKLLPQRFDYASTAFRRTSDKGS